VFAAEGEEAAEEPAVKWVIATTYGNPTVGQAVPFVELAERVRERTDGRFDIHVAMAGELGIKRENFPSALSQNVIQGAELAYGFAEQTWSHLGVFNLPYLFSTEEEVYAALEALAEMTNREYEHDNIMSLAHYVWLPQDLFVRKPIDDITDLNGMKVRGWTDVMLKAVGVMGGQPVSVPSSEVYTAIQHGVADGGITGGTSAIMHAWNEVAPYAYPISFMYVAADVGINREAFDSLPQQYQTVLLEEGQAMTERFKEWYDENEATVWDDWRDLGGEVFELTPDEYEGLQELVGPLWDSWVATVGSDGEEALRIVLEAVGNTD
jgi:TRAP-type C4-dicarboxylate transport system substrate-binding protein